MVAIGPHEMQDLLGDHFERHHSSKAMLTMLEISAPINFTPKFLVQNIENV